MVPGVLSKCYLSLALGAALAAPLAAAEPPVRTRGEEFQANVTFQGNQFESAVASQPGRSMVVWVSELRGLYGRVFDDLGRPVSPELTVDGEPPIRFRPHQIAADAYGGFLVTWVKPQAGTPLQYSVVAQRYDANGEPLGPRLTIYSASSHPSPSSTERLENIDLVSRGTEGFLVAWTSSIASQRRVLLQALDSLGRPQIGAFQVSQSQKDFRSSYPRIAVQPSGNAMVTWIDERETGNPDVWARRVSATGQLQGPEFRVEINNGGEAYAAVPMAHDDGGFSVVWNNTNFGKSTVSAQRFDASGSRSGPPFLLTESARDLSSPAVAADPEGNLLVLWAGFELDPDGGIMGRFFSPSWQPLGDAFRVNTFLPFDQFEPAVAADGRGGFTATWSSGEEPGFLVTGPVHRPGQDGSEYGVFGQQLTTPEPAPCARGSEILCLGQAGRFEVRVSWTRPGGESGTGKAQPLAADTGALWFFGEDNLELLIKVLDGRVVNGHFWVYYGALSDVEYTITVTDTQSHQEKTYHNPPGRLASRADVLAFPNVPTIPDARVVPTGLPPTPPAPATDCRPSSEALCLNQGRFLVEVEAIDPRTNGKVRARAVPLTGDTGAFWFFGEDNLELMIKVLDGRGVNGRFWVYYGALSDVRYTITVTDTVTQETKTYENAPGRLLSRADVEAF